MKSLTYDYQNDKFEFIKNPVVAEFLGLSQNTDFTETHYKTYNIDIKLLYQNLFHIF